MKAKKVIQEPAETAAQRIVKNPKIEFLARLGYAANGLLHGLIGFVALTIAFGSTQEADQSGVLDPLDKTWGGKALLLAIFVGLISLGIWKIAEVILMRRSRQKSKRRRRLEEAGKAIVYLLLGISSVAFLFNHESTSSSIAASEKATLVLLKLPYGVPVLYLICLLLAVVGIIFIVRGVTRRFLDTLTDDAPVSLSYLAVVCGVVGYCAKGVIFIVLGGIFLNAGLTVNPAKASGLDGAFRSFMALPFGSILLFMVGMGFIMYALYSAARARLAEMS